MSYWRRISGTCALLATLCAAPAAAQEGRALSTALGAGAGILGGGYVSISIIVLEARAGRYMHDINDVLGWRSTPVLLGAGIGAGLGAYSPERLTGAVVYGAAGLGVGALVGAGVGSLLIEGPEGKWAGAAIGAGLGLIMGNTLGVFSPIGGDDDDAEPLPLSSGVPLMVRIPL